jgi:hypothetical protein
VLRIFLSLIVIGFSVVEPPGLGDDAGAGICLGCLVVLWLAVLLNRRFVVCKPKTLTKLMVLLVAVSMTICIRRFVLHS